MAKWKAIRDKYKQLLKILGGFMDLCVIDWKVIAPILASLIASGTALYISNKWSGQKGKEVLASEAKNLLSDLYELRSHIELLDSNKIIDDKKFLEEIVGFNDRNSRIKNSLLFLSKELNAKYLVDFNEFIENLKNANIKLAGYKPKNVLESSLAKFHIAQGLYQAQSESFWGNLGCSLESVIQILRNVALYKED